MLLNKKKYILKKILLLSLSLITVISFASCKKTVDGDNAYQSTASAEVYVNKLEDCLNSWANAYYKNDLDTYVKNSCYNPECMSKLGNSEYDYEKLKNEKKSELQAYADYMSENYEFYYVECAASNYEVYQRNSQTYISYIEKMPQSYKNKADIDAFALIEFVIRINYEDENKKLTSESETSMAEAVLIDSNWYILEAEN